MTDAEISSRERSQRAGGGAAKAEASVGPFGRVFAEGKGGRESESEVTTSRTVIDSPITGFNRLLDHLETSSLLKNIGESLSRRDLVDIEGEWEVSPLTDVARLLTKMLSAAGANPESLTSGEMPPDLLSALISTDDSPGTVVLNRIDASPTEPAVVVILGSQHLVNTATVDDLEGDRNVFGTVSALVDENKDYSLESILLGGVPRSVRRSFKGSGVVENLLDSPDFDTNASSINVAGPALVITATAVY